MICITIMVVSMTLGVPVWINAMATRRISLGITQLVNDATSTLDLIEEIHEKTCGPHSGG